MKKARRNTIGFPAFFTTIFILCVAYIIGLRFIESVYPITSVRENTIVQDYASRQLANMTLKQKVSSLFILHAPGTNIDNLRQFLDKYQPSGLIFMSDNIPEDSKKLAEITSSLQINSSLQYLFAIDEEGGIVSRLKEDIYPAAIELRDLPADATQRAFLDRTNLLKSVGLNLNFGIVADITDNNNSFIYKRVFSGDPELAGDKVAAAVTGSIESTLSTLKHFPGHGETNLDSHESIPTTDISYEDWLNYDGVPFEIGIEAGADAVMFGHLRYSSVDQVPASLSIRWHEILKDELGFNGLTITDDMGMLQNSGEEAYSNPITNAIRAINAKNTILLYVLDANHSVSGVDIGEIIDGVVAAVNDGRIDIKLINKNVRQILTVRHGLSVN